MTRLRIRTASRLHFGLFGWGREAPRQFGGLGLMVEEPGVELTAEPSATPIAEGPLASRIQSLLSEFPERFERMGLPTARTSIRVHVRHTPDEHVGLGVGTQVSLAVARAFLECNGVAPGLVNPSMLARLSGRGVRSGIGIHGFFAGGLIVDGGRRSESDIPPLLIRHPFPEGWAVLIVRPPHLGLHGAAERQAFGELPSVPQHVTERLCRLVLLDLLPGFVERDLKVFGEALGAIQRIVGECFSPVQGGAFASSLSASIIDEMTRLSLQGAGQSSWGPTLYAFSEADEAERFRIAQQIRGRFGLPQEAVFWTRAANHGAVVEDLSATAGLND